MCVDVLVVLFSTKQTLMSLKVKHSLAVFQAGKLVVLQWLSILNHWVLSHTTSIMSQVTDSNCEWCILVLIFRVLMHAYLVVVT